MGGLGNGDMVRLPRWSTHPAGEILGLRDDRSLFGELDHAALRVAEVRVRPHGGDDDPTTTKLTQYVLAISHRDIEMEVAHDLPVFRHSDSQRDTAQVDFTVPLHPFAVDVRAE